MLPRIWKQGVKIEDFWNLGGRKLVTQFTRAILATLYKIQLGVIFTKILCLGVEMTPWWLPGLVPACSQKEAARDQLIYRSFYNCGTFWGRLKMTISCKFNKLFFEKYSDWHSYSQGKIAGTGCWSLFLDKKICFCITYGKILSTLLLTNHEML